MEYGKLLQAAKRTILDALRNDYHPAAVFDRILKHQGASLLPPVCNQQLRFGVGLRPVYAGDKLWRNSPDDVEHDAVRSVLEFSFSTNDAYFVNEERGYIEMQKRSEEHRCKACLRLNLQEGWLHCVVGWEQAAFPPFDPRKDIDGQLQDQEGQCTAGRTPDGCLVFACGHLTGEILKDGQNAVVTRYLEAKGFPEYDAGSVRRQYVLIADQADPQEDTLQQQEGEAEEQQRRRLKELHVLPKMVVRQRAHCGKQLSYPPVPSLKRLCGHTVMEHQLLLGRSRTQLPDELHDFLDTVIY